MKKMGSSGFGYTESKKSQDKYSRTIRKLKTNTVEVKNLSTGDKAFTLIGAHRKYQTGKSAAIPKSKTFFGFDGKYYHIVVLHNKVEWGQIQSSGAVIASDRSVIKHLDFYPMETFIPKPDPVMPPQVVNLPQESPVKTFITPQTTIPQVINLPQEPPAKIITTTREEISWYQKIINWIMNLLNR